MLDVAGETLQADEREKLAHPAVGGLILFARNTTSAEQVTQLVADIRAVRPDILIAVDQEGGRVQRMREGFTPLPTMRSIGAMYDDDSKMGCHYAKQIGWLMASEVLAVGIDFSFAPVLDVDHGVSDVIGDRAFHTDPQVVAILAEQFILGMQAAGMAATGKHFPGHGAVTADSHVDLPVDKRDVQTILNVDGVPFEKLAHLLGGIMPAHVVFEQADAQPAGFSRYWLQMVLREQYRFNGVIFSDDLTMEGAAAVGDIVARAEAAMDAGCDMVLVCNQPAEAEKLIDALSNTPLSDASQARLVQMRGQFHYTMSQLQRLNAWQAAQPLS